MIELIFFYIPYILIGAVTFYYLIRNHRKSRDVDLDDFICFLVISLFWFIALPTLGLFLFLIYIVESKNWRYFWTKTIFKKYEENKSAKRVTERP